MKNRQADSLATAIARLLTGRDGASGRRFEADPAIFHQEVLRYLAHGRGGAYQRELIGAALFRHGEDAEELAERWFFAVLDRPLSVHPRAETHKAHDLLLALSRLGAAPGWAGAEMARGGDAAETTAAGPEGFADVRRRLSALPDPRRGGGRGAALSLRALDAGARVPEGLSVWGAAQGMPRWIFPLSGDRSDPRWIEMLYLTRNLVETANVHWEALRCCGLNPADWTDRLTINQAKELSFFLGLTRELAEARGAHRHDPAIWALAWAERPVPKFDDVEALRTSDVGQRIINDTIYEAQDVHTHEEEEEPDIDVTDIPMPHPAAESCPGPITRLREAGVLVDLDVWFMTLIALNETPATIRDRPDCPPKLRSQKAMDAYVRALARRVETHRHVESEDEEDTGSTTAHGRRDAC